jgi:hypothetical protein
MRFIPGCSTKEVVCLLCAEGICTIFLMICMVVAWRGTATYPKPGSLRTSACATSPEQLTNCAAAWTLLAQPKFSRSGWAYWQAAEFQGFVDGISRGLIVGKDWCPEVSESGGEVGSFVADYLVAHRGQKPLAHDATTTVVILLSSKAPCVHSNSGQGGPESQS